MPAEALSDGLWHSEFYHLYILLHCQGMAYLNVSCWDFEMLLMLTEILTWTCLLIDTPRLLPCMSAFTLYLSHA